MSSRSIRRPETTLTDEWAALYLPGGWIGRYVRWACKTTHAPPLFHLLTAVSYASFELARRGWWLDGVAGGFSQKAPTTWFALLAESGGGKSSSLSRIRAFDEAVQRATPVMLLDSRMQGGTSLIAVRGSHAGVFTELEKRVYSDLRGGSRTCALLVNDELNVILEMARKDPTYASNFLELHDQNDMRFLQRGIQKEEDGDRRGYLPATAISSVFVSTREQINDIFDKRMLHGGFASRFLWFCPPPGAWDYWPIEPGRKDEELQSVATDYVRWLEAVGTRTADDGLIAIPEEGEVYEAHYDWAMTLHERHPYGSPNRVLYVPRMAQATGILAAVISTVHATPSSGPVVVDIESYTIARNLVTDAYNAVPMLIALAASKEIQDDNAMIQALENAGRAGLSRAEVGAAAGQGLRSLPSLLKAAQETGALVALLIRSGRPGPPITRYYHPLFAPPSPLRIQGKGIEYLDEEVCAEWARGDSADTILARRSPTLN